METRRTPDGPIRMPCDAPHPTIYQIGLEPDGSARYACLCLVCGRCNKHTGNQNQGHYWSYCKATRTLRTFHFCCPGDCELEARERARVDGVEFVEPGGMIGYFPDPPAADDDQVPAEVGAVATDCGPQPLDDDTKTALVGAGWTETAPGAWSVPAAESTPAPAAETPSPASAPAADSSGSSSGGDSGGGGGGCD